MNARGLSTDSDDGLAIVSAILGLLIGLFLLTAAYGHLSAVLPMTDSPSNPASSSLFKLLLPAIILTTTGLLNIVLSRWLWKREPWAQNLALLGNTLALAYLVYLLLRSVPGHPIGLFTAIVASYLLLLTAIRLGLRWPSLT